MRSIAAALTAILVGAPLVRGELTPLGKERVETAERWLKVLKIKYQGDLTNPDAPALKEALKQWATRNKEDDNKHPPSPEPVRGAIPNSWARIARIGALSAERLSTQSSVFGKLDTDPNGQDRFIPNPDHALYTYTGTISPGEMYVSVSDRTGLCKAATSIWKVETTYESLHCKDSAYLSASRGKDIWGRVALSFKVNVSAVQIPHYVSSVVLSPSAPGRGWNKTISGSFDPALLFRSTDEWASWADYYKDKMAGAGVSESLSPRVLPSECRSLVESQEKMYLRVDPSIAPARESDESRQSRTQACFDRLARGSKRHQALTTILPMVTVKGYTPFDYVKTAGTTFVQPPGGGRTIYDVVFSWDAKKVIPSASSRVKAMQASAGLTSLPKDKDKPVNEWEEKIREHYEMMLTNPDLPNDHEWWKGFSMLMALR